MKGKISLSFRKNSVPIFLGSIEPFLKSFDIESDSQQLANVQKLISNSDVSFKRAIDNGEVVNLNFFVTDTGLQSHRFQKFVPMLFRDKKHDKTLYNYQIEGIKWLLNNPKCILADDMGLGKTLQVIKASEQEIFIKKTLCVFIFCPNALVNNWISELTKWFSMSIAKSFIKGELAKIANSSNFVVISYPQMQNFLTEYDELGLDAENITIFDEAHKLRNSGALVSRLSKSFNTTIKWLLTGTPLERDEKDIDTILQIINPGFQVGKLKNDTFLMKSRFKNLTLRRTKDIALKELPPVSHHIHYVDMSRSQEHQYNCLIKDYKDRPKSEKIGVLTQLMIAATNQSDGLSNKFLAALAIVSENIIKHEKSIVFTKFNIVLEKFSHELRSQGVNHILVNGKIGKDERDRLIKQFQNNDDCHVLLINLAIGSEGLTLTEANNVLFLNEAWNPSMNRQAEDRVNRIGQHRPVNIHIFRTKNSIDINLEAILTKKLKLEGEYIDLLLEEVF